MLYQPWVQSERWESGDPKLRQLQQLPRVLPHTTRLANAIDIAPAGLLMVRGPRQAGKSTFLRQFIQRALHQGVAANRIGLLEAESLESRHDLLGEIKNFLGQTGDYAIVCIDEVTAIEQWWRALKLLADEGLLENALVLCTGSSSEDLLKGADLLPGRRGRRYPVDFELLPARFADVAQLISQETFLLTGGFPWAINEYLRTGAIPPFVYELYSAWIQGAFVRGNHSTQNLAALLRYLAQRTGSSLSVAGLARDCGLGSNHTAETYISLLVNNYILLPARWSEPGSGVTAARKNRKYFPADPLLFHLFCSAGQSQNHAFPSAQQRLQSAPTLGPLIECLVASELRHRVSMFPLRYFLGKKEIDFIGSEAVEVKYQNRVSLEEFSWVDKILPPDMPFTVVTKQTTSTKGRMRAVALTQWLLEDR